MIEMESLIEDSVGSIFDYYYRLVLHQIFKA